MNQKYEYKFVRLGEGVFASKSKALEEYQQIVKDHAQDGWRLVQIFAPGTTMYGQAKYIEVILERELITQQSR